LRKGLVPALLEGRDYNHARAQRVVKIMEQHRLADVPGQPLMRDAAGPWLAPIAGAIAGALHADGKSRITDVLIELPKKSSKTSYMSILMNSLLLASPRPRAEFLLVAPTHAIAEIAFRAIAGAIYADTELAQLMHVREHLKVIEHRGSGCRLVVRTFDMNVATGVKPAAVLLDEVWLLQDESADRVVGQLRGGQASIPEAVTIMISTASDRPAVGFWRSELDKARRVRDGEIDLPGYLPCLWEFPKDVAADESKWSDPDNWHLVNPNLGRSVQLDWLKQSFASAQATSRTETLRWASQHLNLHLVGNIAGVDNRWAGGQHWDRQRHPTIRTLDQLLDACDIVSVGVDGGGSDDLFAVSVLGRLADQPDHWIVWTRAWCYPGVLEIRKSISGRLRDFERDGDLRIEQPGTDMQEIGELIAGIHERGLLHQVGIDPAGVGQDVAQVLTGHGLSDDTVLAVKQGFALLPAWTSMERRLAEGRMWHCGQDLMGWCVSNCTKSDRGLVTKAVSGAAKIDSAVAMANAAMLMLDAPEPFCVGALIG